MRVVIYGETDLQMHFIMYAMKYLGFDCSDEGNVLDFEREYSEYLDTCFSNVDNIVLPMLKQVTKLNEPNAWFAYWIPVTSPYIVCAQDVKTKEYVGYECRIDDRHNLKLENIIEAKIVERIAFLVNKYADGKVSASFVVDALKAVLKDKQLINAIYQDMKDIVINGKKPDDALEHISYEEKMRIESLYL